MGADRVHLHSREQGSPQPSPAPARAGCTQIVAHQTRSGQARRTKRVGINAKSDPGVKALCRLATRSPSHPIPSHRVEGGDIPGGVNGSSLGLPSLPPSLAHLAAQLQLQLQDRSWHSSRGERELLAVFLGEGWYWTVKKTKRAQANGGRSWTAWKLGPEIGGEGRGAGSRGSGGG